MAQDTGVVPSGPGLSSDDQAPAGLAGSAASIPNAVVANVTVRRIHAGSYIYSLGGLAVEVVDREPNPAFGDTKRMWTAFPTWENHWGAISDPVETKREAVGIALRMLAEKAA